MTDFTRGAGADGPVVSDTAVATIVGNPASATRTSLSSTYLTPASLPAVSVGPACVTPPASVLTAAATGVWYTVNAATFMRFSLTSPRTYRYVNLYVGVASGNIQVGVCRVKDADNSTVYATRVASSGVVACPATGAQRVDLGFVTLPPGEYLLFLWCDNVTATFMHGLATGITASRLCFNSTLVGGVPAGVTTVGTTTRWVSGLTLEAGKFPTVLLGDSITANQTWWDTADEATGNRFCRATGGLSPLTATNAGIGGNQTSQMLARVAADVTSLAPRYVSVLGGTNDVGNDVASATTIANLTSIYNAITAAGGQFVACTIPPRMGSVLTNPLTPAQVVLLKTVNAWIRANYMTWAGARLCDWSWALSDGTDESSPLAGNFVDGVHPNATGEAIMAPIMARAVSAWA